MDYLFTEKRGKFLTVVFFLEVWFLITFIMEPRTRLLYPENIYLSSQWFYWVNILLSSYLLWESWFWKRWALYGLIIFKIIPLGLFFWFSTRISAEQYALMIYEGIFIGLLIWASNRKRQYFN